MERAIRAVQGSKHGRMRAVVSTDDDEIAEVARRASAEVLRRKPVLAQSSTRMDDVVWDFIQDQQLDDDDLLVLLEPTAPLRTPADIDLVIDIIRATNAPAVRMVSVQPKECHGYIYVDAGLATVIRAGQFTGLCLFPQGTILVHAGDNRAVDIDNQVDLERARSLVAQRCEAHGHDLACSCEGCLRSCQFG